MVDRPNKPSALASTPGLPPQAQVSVDNAKVTAVLPTGESVEVLLFGATVLSWKAKEGKDERLWLSSAAKLDGSKAVRGGIPLVFPVSVDQGTCPAAEGLRGKPWHGIIRAQVEETEDGYGPSHWVGKNRIADMHNPPGQVFGTAPDHKATSKLPQHGFARNSTWEFLGKSTSESTAGSSGGSGSSAADLSVKLDFGLSSASLDAKTRALWPYAFNMIYSVTLERDSLTTNLVVTNDGDEPFECQVLMHTYLRVKVRESCFASSFRCS